MISLSAAVMFIVYLLVAGLIFYLLNWLIGYVGVPDPFAKVLRIVLAILAVLVVIGLLLSLIGHGPVFRP